MKVREIVSYNLKRLRKERNMTQMEFSELLGISQSTLNNYELQLRDIKEANRESMAKNLGVDESEFYIIPNQKTKPTQSQSYGELISLLAEKTKNIPDNIIELLSQLDPGQDEYLWSRMELELQAKLENQIREKEEKSKKEIG